MEKQRVANKLRLARYGPGYTLGRVDVPQVRAGFASLGVSSTRGRIARSRNTSVGPWLRSIFVVAAVVWGLVAVGAHAGLASGDHHAVHPPHALLTAVGAEFAVDVGHAHLVDGSGSRTILSSSLRRCCRGRLPRWLAWLWWWRWWRPSWVCSPALRCRPGGVRPLGWPLLLRVEIG